MPSVGNESTPAVSVVMPVYNGERFLAEAIESILNQTFTDFEFLIFDDGSTDRSLDIARAYAECDSRIRLFEHSHSGVVAASNVLLRAARADWVARMDSDDIAAPGRLEKQVEFVGANKEVAAVGSWSFVIGESGKVVGKHSFGPVNEFEFQAYRAAGPFYLTNPTVMMRRGLVLGIGGYREDYETAEDADLFTRLADKDLLLVLPEPLLRYRVHSGAMSTTRFIYQQFQLRRIAHNMRLRRSGLRELDEEQFRAFEASESWHVRTKRALTVRSRGYYRRAGGQLTAGHLQGLVWLGGSALLNPAVPLGRLRRQGVLSQLPGPSRLRKVSNRLQRDPE